jgi:propanediol dehydratase small subunit
MPEYPLSERMPSELRTPSGRAFEEITLDAVLTGAVGMEDLRVTAEALELQAQVADSAGRPQLAENLRRASELVRVPDERVLEIYDALRPGRRTREQLLALAGDLEREFGAVRCAALVREAAGA